MNLGIAFYSYENSRTYAYADSDFGSDESRRVCAEYGFIHANGNVDFHKRFHCLLVKLRSE